MLQNANAFLVGRTARASGDASRFDSAAAAYRLAPDVTASRLYLETVEQVLPGRNKLIVDKTTKQTPAVSVAEWRPTAEWNSAFALGVDRL